MDPNPSHPPKVDTDSDESIVQSPQPSAKTSPEELTRPYGSRQQNSSQQRLMKFSRLKNQ
ncbi:hypothetical protein T11_4164 [Trichinella zimbabwensis]|uniref:Uncharacterized protein n=1 Tax=Trichinella zimbabwensis TaxID=268475 RepID=A0A0V1I1D0_9BILA|nr:hypothetical protein T11_4164 [Trichinella zimbabwensis]